MTPSNTTQYFERSQRLLGTLVMQRLAETRVILFGCGGVGSWCAESLVRSGLGHITIVDNDVVCPSNCNRQLMATTSTVGQNKVEAMKKRLLELNPELDITIHAKFYDAASAHEFHLENYDFIIDAIDSLASKAHLILQATALPKTITLLCSMGAALRIDPQKVRAGEFWDIKGDALARALRNKFKKDKTFPKRKFTCVYSEEVALPNQGECSDSANGSLSHITGTFGFMLAGLVIKKITSEMQKTLQE